MIGRNMRRWVRTLFGASSGVVPEFWQRFRLLAVASPAIPGLDEKSGLVPDA